jgi:hypothetical protein
MLDLQAFLNAALQPRQQRVPVPELEQWLTPGAEAVWVVRGLTAAELARANQAAEHGLANVRALVAALAGDAANKAATIRQTLGLSDEDVPADISRRIEMLAAGSVSPALGPDNRDVAVKLAETYATRFYELTNVILNLTGQGAEPGKAKRSGPTPA